MARVGLIQREKDPEMPEMIRAVMLPRRGVRSRDSADSLQGHRVTLQHGRPVLLPERRRTTQRSDQRIHGLLEQTQLGWEPELPE